MEEARPVNLNAKTVFVPFWYTIFLSLFLLTPVHIVISTIVICGVPWLNRPIDGEKLFDDVGR